MGQYKAFQIGSNILKCHLIDYHINKLPPFYKDLLKSYKRLFDNKRDYPTPISEIFNEPILDNPLIHKRLFYDESFITCEIRQIRDLCYEVVPGFMPEAAVMEVTDNLLNTESLNRLIENIPQAVQEAINTTIPGPRQIHYDFLVKNPFNQQSKLLSTFTSRDFYTALIHVKANPLTQKFRLFWESQIGPVHWETFFVNLFKRTGDTKSFDIQWKFIQLCLPTADRLTRFGILKDPTCLRCRKHTETSSHLFINCPEVKLLWSFICTKIRKLGNAVDLGNLERLVAIGLYEYNQALDAENTLRDIAFSTIWSTRNKIVFDNERLDLRTIFKQNLRHHIKDQLFLASHTNIYNFKNIWCKNYALAKIVNDKLVFQF